MSVHFFGFYTEQASFQEVQSWTVFIGAYVPCTKTTNIVNYIKYTLGSDYWRQFAKNPFFTTTKALLLANFGTWESLRTHLENSPFHMIFFYSKKQQLDTRFFTQFIKAKQQQKTRHFSQLCFCDSFKQIIMLHCVPAMLKEHSLLVAIKSKVGAIFPLPPSYVCT